MTPHDKNQKIIESALPKLSENAEKAEAKILELLIAYVEGLPSSGGRFVWDKSAMKLLAQLGPKIQKALNGANFEDSLLKYFDNFDELGKNLKDLHRQRNDIIIPKRDLEAAKASIVEITLEGLVQANMNQLYLVPVRQGLFNKIRFGASVTETEAYLRQLIQGTEEGGVIQRWVGQVARDAANQYEGTIHQKVKDDYGFTNWEYVGTIVKNSRPQCIRWVKMERIPDEDLEDQLAWAFANGSGMIPGTDRSTFGIYRGGYNCLHSAIPTR